MPSSFHTAHSTPADGGTATRAAGPIDGARALAVLAALPVIAVIVAGGRAIGPISVDLVWALSRMWGAGHGAGFHTTWLDFPVGTDLLASAGGWTDVWLGGLLARVVGPIVAYNLVSALYLWTAGAGGWALAREAGVRHAWLAGLLLELDPGLLTNLAGGRIERGAIGLGALALVAGIRAWNGSYRAAILGGLAAGALALCGWELAFVLALCVPFGVAAAWTHPPADGRLPGLGRGLLALGVATAVAGPLLAAYLGTPTEPAPGFSRWLAVSQSIGLVPSWDDPRPALPVLLAIPAWLLARDRRLSWPIAAGAVVLGALALGPAPSAWTTDAPIPWDRGQDARDAAVAAWAPFTWLSAIFPRYHWPDQLLLPIGVLGAVAAASVAERLRPWMIAVALAWVVAVDVPVLPRGRMRLAVPAPIAALSRKDGAVLDLPLWQDPALHLEDQLHQLVHGHPIGRSMQLFHLDPAIRPRLRADPVTAWFLSVTGPEAPSPARFDRDDLSPWRRAGFGWVTLRRGPMPDDRWDLATTALSGLGPPDLADGDGWRAWRLR